MKLALVRDVGVIIIFFQFIEVATASLYLELILEEEKAESNVPPEPRQYLFKNLNTAEKYPHILFSHKDFFLGIRFLEVIAMATAKEGGQTKGMEQFLCQLNAFSKTLSLQ